MNQCQLSDEYVLYKYPKNMNNYCKFSAQNGCFDARSEGRIVVFVSIQERKTVPKTLLTRESGGELGANWAGQKISNSARLQP